MACRKPWKNKTHYEIYLLDSGRLEEYKHCWACADTAERDFDNMEGVCSLCPITWPEADCCNEESPYKKWDDEVHLGAPDIELCRKYALEIVELLKQLGNRRFSMDFDLKKERIKNKMTQIKLSQAVGVSVASVRLWEQGGGEPSPENMKKLKKVLGIVEAKKVSV